MYTAANDFSKSHLQLKIELQSFYTFHSLVTL